MLYWPPFFIIAIIAAVLGFGNRRGGRGIAQVQFFVSWCCSWSRCCCV
jgi:uncharacterized membrane protein YtjA (UPF0391 family)